MSTNQFAELHLTDQMFSVLSYKIYSDPRRIVLHTYHWKTYVLSLCFHNVYFVFFCLFFLFIILLVISEMQGLKNMFWLVIFFVLFIDSYLSLSLSVYFYIASCHTILLVQLLRVRCTLLFKSVQNKIDCIDSLVQFVDGIFSMECAINL